MDLAQFRKRKKYQIPKMATAEWKGSRWDLLVVERILWRGKINYSFGRKGKMSSLSRFDEIVRSKQ